MYLHTALRCNIRKCNRCIHTSFLCSVCLFPRHLLDHIRNGRSCTDHDRNTSSHLRQVYTSTLCVCVIAAYHMTNASDVADTALTIHLHVMWMWSRSTKTKQTKLMFTCAKCVAVCDVCVREMGRNIVCEYYNGTWTSHTLHTQYELMRWKKAETE